MTYANAIASGYKPGEVKYQRGYVSRKGYDLDNATVYTAKGSRNGQLYVLTPCWTSTQYCFRQYLTK